MQQSATIEQTAAEYATSGCPSDDGEGPALRFGDAEDGVESHVETHAGALIRQTVLSARTGRLSCTHEELVRSEGSGRSSGDAPARNAATKGICCYCERPKAAAFF